MVLPSGVSTVCPESNFFMLPAGSCERSRLLLFSSSIKPVALSLIRKLFVNIGMLFSNVISAIRLLAPDDWISISLMTDFVWGERLPSVISSKPSFSVTVSSLFADCLLEERVSCIFLSKEDNSAFRALSSSSFFHGALMISCNDGISGFNIAFSFWAFAMSLGILFKAFKKLFAATDEE